MQPSPPSVPIASPIVYSDLTKFPAPGMSLSPGTSPTVVQYQDTYYCYFTGSLPDGIWVSTSADGATWKQVQQLKPSNTPFLSVASGTSPSALVYNDSIMVFYTGSGGRVWVATTTDGVSCQPSGMIIPPNEPLGVGISGSTSPSTLVFKGKILLFYNGLGNNGVFMTSFDGSTWSPTSQVTANGSALNIAANTSPSAVIYDDEIYLFYTVGGSTSGSLAPSGQTSPPTRSSNAIWYATSSDGATWVQPGSLQSLMGSGAMSVMQGTGPAAFSQGSALWCFWNSLGGLAASVTLDGSSWELAALYSSEFTDGQTTMATTASAAMIGNYPNVLWNVATASQTTGTLYNSPFLPIFSLTQDAPSISIIAAQNGLSFVFAVDDPTAVQDLTNMLAASGITLASPGESASPNVTNVTAIQPYMLNGGFLGLGNISLPGIEAAIQGALGALLVTEVVAPVTVGLIGAILVWLRLGDRLQVAIYCFLGAISNPGGTLRNMYLVFINNAARLQG